MSDRGYAGRTNADFGRAVEWVREALPLAIAWAEADILATKRARRANLDAAVKRGRCAVGHDWHTGLACGYCQSAAQHARLWGPPTGPPHTQAAP